MIDVCLLLEGTYPYVAGGVSTWVHQLISSMRDIKFGIVYIAPHSDPTRHVKYKIPENVIYLKEIFLHEYDLKKQKLKKEDQTTTSLIKTFYDDLLQSRYNSFTDFISLFQGNQSVFDTHKFFKSQKIWDLLVNFYQLIEEDVSFLDFFWTWRSTHLPLLQILRAKVPEAKVYHAVSTGYAGLLGAVARSQSKSKFFLTEHGIYTHERTLEISQSDWLYERESRNYRAERDLSFFKQFWIKMFQVMSQLTYNHADQIFTLYEGNKQKQILEGADPHKIRLIPNGIDLKRFSNIKRTKKTEPQIGFIGRVVSIKDVKTFIQAAKIVLQKKPNAEFYVLGPTDEEEDYFEDVKNLTNTLQIQDKIHFMGSVNIESYLSFLDLVILTSVSEAQPYVILEANICGIPVVATDVGACRELLSGRSEDDVHLGPSGIITEVANPSDTAEKILTLLDDQQLYESMSQSGIARIKKYYDQDTLLSSYLNLYEKNFH